MPRVLSIFLSCLLIAASMLAEDSLPIVEMKADRTMVYPQRMALEGEESLLDVLPMNRTYLSQFITHLRVRFLHLCGKIDTII